MLLRMAVLDRVEIDEERVRDDSAWYWGIPAVATVRRTGLELASGVTVLLGENGTGKSTLIEAIAFAWRRNLTAAVHHWGPQAGREDTDLHWCLRLHGDRPISHGGCFLRAEAMHQHFAGLDRDGSALRAFGNRQLNARSHGESFLAFLESRGYERGLYVLDEPEAALSFRSCLMLITLLSDAVRAGSQAILATHSPILAAIPGAHLLELSDDGIEPRSYDELPLVADWRDFLAAPERWTKHLT